MIFQGIEEWGPAKCLTVCQPWAWAIAAGLKTVENRTWYTPYRGELLIHAGKSKAWMRAVRESGYLRLPEMDEVREKGLAFGAVVAICELVECVPVAQVPRTRFSEGPWCWKLRNVRPLVHRPVLKGSLGVFNVEVRWPRCGELEVRRAG